jgi:thymidylate synthase ThyX
MASYIDSIEKMKKKSVFNLSKILDETTNKLKEAFPDAQKYLLELSKEELQTRLTSGQALEVAKTLLEKIGVKADSR